MNAHAKAIAALTRSIGRTNAIKLLDAASEDFTEILDLFDLAGAHVFAEDAFGDLFVDDGAIRKIVLTTDVVENVCDGIDSFAHAVASDPDQMIGRDFLRRWEKANGPLKEGYRLCQVIPVLMGAPFDLDNFKPVQGEETRRYACLILRTARENPNGSVRIVVDTDKGDIRFEPVIP